MLNNFKALFSFSKYFRVLLISVIVFFFSITDLCIALVLVSVSINKNYLKLPPDINNC